MKKTRIMIILLSLSMIFLGVGYAAWTDSLTINSTVQTGKLDVNFQQSASSIIWNADNNNVANGFIAIDETKNTATVTLNNLYPHAIATITIPIKNEGTIPVKDGTFNFLDVPDWLIVNSVNQVPVLDVGQQENFVFTVNVLDSAPQDTTVKFDIKAIYKQFNAQ